MRPMFSSGRPTAENDDDDDNISGLTATLIIIIHYMRIFTTIALLQSLLDPDWRWAAFVRVAFSSETFR